MTTDVAVREPQALTVLSNEQLKFIAGTEFVPKGLRNNLPAILACVATGRAIGIDDMTALRCINMVDGKPSFAAELMVMLVRRRGHSITGEVGAESATVTGTRADNGDTMTSTFTVEMAKRAHLETKQNWIRYPESMCWARAVSQLCRMLFADCFAGGTYTSEELGDEEPQAVEVEPGLDPGVDGWFPPEDTLQNATGAEPSSGAPTEAANSGGASVAVISDKDRRRLHAIRTEAGMTVEELKVLVADMLGVDSTSKIPAARYEELCEAVKKFGKTEASGFAARAAEAQANRDAS